MWAREDGVAVGGGRRASRIRLATSGLLLALYLTVVLVVTLWPTPIDRGYESTIVRLLEILHQRGFPAWFGYHKLEFAANAAMFVPVGFLLALTAPAARWRAAIVAVTAFSALIELTQAGLLTARVSSFIDVLANTIGGIIGVLMALGLRAVVHARDQLVVAAAVQDRPAR
jgi:glycopeptide antibiotics resistance protein